jgi:hypothetical protein
MVKSQRKRRQRSSHTSHEGHQDHDDIFVFIADEHTQLAFLAVIMIPTKCAMN